MEVTFEEFLFHNGTATTTYSAFELGIITTACLLFTLVDVIFIIVIASNSFLHTRANKIMLTYLIIDVCLQLVDPFYTTNLHELITPPLKCVLDKTQLALVLFNVIAILMLSTDCIVLSKKCSDKTVIGVFGISLAVTSIGLSLLCVLGQEVKNLVYDTVSTIAFCLLLAFVVKDVYVCFKNNDNTTKEAKLRTEVARIYVYMKICLDVILRYYWGQLDVLIYIIEYLISVFIFLYVYCKDERFRICVANLFKKTENRRAVVDA